MPASLAGPTWKSNRASVAKGMASAQARASNTNCTTGRCRRTNASRSRRQSSSVHRVGGDDRPQPRDPRKDARPRPPRAEPPQARRSLRSRLARATAGIALASIFAADMDADRPPTMRDYGRVVLRRKWIVITAVATALLGALAMSLLQDPIYRAEAQMLVEPRSGEAVFQEDPALNVQNLERSIQTEIKVLEGQQVRERVQQDLGLEALPPEVDATPVGSTDVVSVTVQEQGPPHRSGPRRRLCPGVLRHSAGASCRQPRSRRDRAPEHSG